MSYRVAYRADGWAAAAEGVPEWRQVVTHDLGDGTTLVVVVVRSVNEGRLRVAQARIEQPYITRTAGWKRPTIRRLRPLDVELVEAVDV
jgi:hypothetical protein